MRYTKKLLFAAIFTITLSPAMQVPVSPEIQLAFQQALDAHDFEQAEILLRQGANPNAISRDWGGSNMNLLAEYARHGTVEQVIFLLEHGADPFHCGTHGHNALHSSVFNRVENALKIIPLLVQKVGVDYPQSIRPKRTALHFSAQKRNKDLIELLLQLGADPNSKLSINGYSAGETPLDEALSPLNTFRKKTTYFPAIKMLYLYGAHPRIRVLEDCLTPEQIAELKQVRGQRLLARRDCDYLELQYPYPSDDQLGENQAPYKALYNNELGTYLPLLLAPLVEICSDYSGNTLPGALLDPAYADAEAGEQRSSY